MIIKEVQEFLHMFKLLKNEIIKDLKETYSMPDDSLQWINDMIEYNCKGGKMNRGISVLHCTHELMLQNNNEKLFLSEIKNKALILGWCIEILQAFFLVADDIMDESLTRRGQACWYRRLNVKMIAINDSFILESFVFQIIKKYFKMESYYMDLIELFHQVIYQTELGQLLDLTTQKQEEDLDLSRFNPERYKKIVILKTAFYTFYLPAACAMYLSGVVQPHSFKLAEEICLKIGEYFQVQDDYLDCYGSEEITGKRGTDIQDAKCSWLVVTLLAKISHTKNEKETRKAIMENYGKEETENVNKIKELYEYYKLQEIYEEYEDNIYKEIVTLIEKNHQKIPKSTFLSLVSKIYKRNK